MEKNYLFVTWNNADYSLSFILVFAFKKMAGAIVRLTDSKCRLFEYLYIYANNIATNIVYFYLGIYLNI